MKKIANFTLTRLITKKMFILVFFGLFMFNNNIFAVKISDLDIKEDREKIIIILNKFRDLSPEEKREFTRKLSREDRQKFQEFKSQIQEKIKNNKPKRINPDREFISRDNFLRDQNRIKPERKDNNREKQPENNLREHNNFKEDRRPPRPPMFDQNNERHKKIKERLDRLKDNFEKKKDTIIRDYKEGKISREEAVKKLFSERERLIKSHDREIEKTMQEEVKENINRLKITLQKELDKKLKNTYKLSSDRQIELYNNIIEKIDIALNNTKIEEKNKVLFTLLKDILQEKIDNFKK
ncbi:MAG: hypothetical protein N4A38_00360 [Candidatus Gracilibacteria bacterium]|nr:hypothetical protein [Candidatus Gracilibacteria bacterium]